MAIIAVRGTASRMLPAELTVAHVSVAITNSDRETALAEADRVYSKLVADAEGFLASGAVTRVNIPPVHAWVEEQWVMPTDSRHSQGLQQVIRHRAGGDIDVWFSDADELTTWLTSVGKLATCVVRPITWDITDATRQDAIRALRTAAAQDAVARATDYSSALGLRYLHLSILRECDATPGAEPPAVIPASSEVTNWTQADAQQNPRMIELSVTVDAEFDVE